jgi:hypothetical protein
MLARAYRAVKDVAPQLPVAAAGLAFTEGNGAEAVNDLDYLRDLFAAGAADTMDALAVHPYGFGRPPDESPSPDRLNFRRLELYRARMEASDAAARPVWITEMGWRSAAPNPDDRWQVVTPAQQRSYTLAALDRARSYAWLVRVALWELNADVDRYGYALWQGRNRTTPAYDALVARATRDALEPPREIPAAAIEILAPDVIIRLGDRGDLHPHWVHLHRGGERFSPDWQGEFFVDDAQANQPQTLLLETMQIDQPTNALHINGQPVGLLQPRRRPDPTSTWVTQRIELKPGVLRPGVNTLVVTSGERNPTLSFHWWRWENFQFRNVRVQPAARTQPEAAWRSLPSPPGWTEAIRLRRGVADRADQPVVWITGNRSGQIWRGVIAAAGAFALTPMAANRVDLTFNSVADDGAEQVVATNHGLFWRSGGAWLPVGGAPPAYAHAVQRHSDGWYAGLERRGLWRATAAGGPWQPAGLSGYTVLDIASQGARLIAATDNGVFVRQAQRWQKLPALPIGERSATDANYVTRVFIGANGEMVVRSEARLWQWDDRQQRWLPFGPPALQGGLYAVVDCCAAGTLVGSNGSGLWRLAASGTWQRVDGTLFDDLRFSEGVRIGSQMVWSTTNGVFLAAADALLAAPATWRPAYGLPSTITALLVDPVDPTRWLAAGPVGIFRSADGGTSWQRVSPPWIVWQMALGADGRLFVTRTGGVSWADDPWRAEVEWQAASGLEGVTFFTVSPDPNKTSAVWAGTWGNDIAVSLDGGASLARLGAGLETLSILAIWRHPTPGQFTIGTIEGLYRSDDGGASWFKLPGLLASQTVYALHEAGGVLWAGAADGLWRSTDYGASWERRRDLPAATILRLGRTVTPAAELLWAGSEDAGLWWSRDDGATWSFGGLEGRSVYTVVAVGERLMAATDRGLWEVESPGVDARKLSGVMTGSFTE